MSSSRGPSLLLEINARLLVRRFSRRAGEGPALAALPDEAWSGIAGRFDSVWLMGLWRRSPAARVQALRHPDLRKAYSAALPDWTEGDVAGSPYAVHAYELDPSLGAPGDLPRIRSRLNRLGLRLVVDFVPHHLARDHPWLDRHPDRFLQGSEDQVRDHPDRYFRHRGRWFAHGRDPHFPPWTDTAQVNFFSGDMRRALTRELVSLSEVADGVRCDMAMLGLNEVFGGVWKDSLAAEERPGEEFWAGAIARVKERRPGFRFLAEAYWGLEGRLLELGFDAVYDKTLYDLLRGSGAGEVRARLQRDPFPAGTAVRFIENHDEPRAAAAFGPERSRAAAAVIATLPGVRLFHDGQASGRRVRLPVQLVREPVEPEDRETALFYDRLLDFCRQPALRRGRWGWVEPEPDSPGDGTHRNLLSWSWSASGQVGLVVVNYSGAMARGRLGFPAPGGRGDRMALHDHWTGQSASAPRGGERHGKLAVDLSPWTGRLLRITSA